MCSGSCAYGVVGSSRKKSVIDLILGVSSISMDGLVGNGEHDHARPSMFPSSFPLLSLVIYLWISLEHDIAGSSGNDILHGNVGDDIVQGGSGNDQIFGDDGNDVLT